MEDPLVDLFLRHLALQALHIHPVALTSAQLATIRWYLISSGVLSSLMHIISESGRLPSSQSAIDGPSTSSFQTPIYSQHPVEDNSTAFQKQSWNPPYDPTPDEVERYSYPRNSLAVTLPEYTRRDPSVYLAAPPYPYSSTSATFNHSSELPAADSLSLIDLNNSLLHPPRTQSEQAISNDAADVFTRNALMQLKCT